MLLDSELISQFVKSTKDEVETKKESIVYGTVVVNNGTSYVKIDGSSLLTPITTTANIKSGERVTVMIKNHTATVTGNITSPSASNADVENMGRQITTMDGVLGETVSITDFNAEKEKIVTLESNVDDITHTLSLMKTAVLYESSSGTDGQVTLEVSSSNYSYLEIYYTDLDNKISGYTKVYSPNGKMVCLQIHDTESAVYSKLTNYTISEKALIPDVYTATCVTFTETGTLATVGTNNIKIVRVVGIM